MQKKSENIIKLPMIVALYHPRKRRKKKKKEMLAINYNSLTCLWEINLLSFEAHKFRFSESKKTLTLIGFVE